MCLNPIFTNAVTAYLHRTGYDSLTPAAALIDMDGTLYDSMPRHARAWMAMCAENNLQSSQEEIFMSEGMTGAATIDRMFLRCRGRHATEQEKKELYAQKSAFFAAQPAAPLMPGAREMVNIFHEHHIRTVLVTGSGQLSLLEKVNADFDGAFPDEMRVTALDVSHGKPHPEPFLMGMSKAGVSPWQAIAVENAPLGVRAAAASGAFTIAVVTGPLNKQALVDAGADIVFNSMPECKHFLPDLLYSMKNYHNHN